MTEKQQAERGERLRMIRKDLGLDQESFAKRIGFSQSQLSRTERGVLEIQVEQQLALIELGYNLNWLMAEIGPMTLDRMQENMPLAADSGNLAYQRERDRRLEELEAFIREKFPDFNR